MGCCKMARDLLGYSKQQARIDAGLAVEKVSVAIFDNKIVEKEWGTWLENAFAAPQVYNSLLYLLCNGIADNRFIKPVTDYGLDLVEVAFTSKQVARSSSQMSYDVLVKEPRVVKAAYDLTCWYVMDPRALEAAQKLMCDVHCRGDVCDVMSWQV